MKYIIIGMVLGLLFVGGVQAATTVQSYDVLEDGRNNEASPDTVDGSSNYDFIGDWGGESNHYLKWDFTDFGIPAGQIIIEAYLYRMIYYDNGEKWLSVHHVYEDGWNEDTMTWNNQVCGTAFNNATACNLTAENASLIIGNPNDVYMHWNITHMIQKAYTDGDTNFSLMIRNDSLSYSGANLYFKENSGTSKDPYINVTYGLPPAIDNDPVATLNSPTDASQDGDGDITFNCSATDDFKIENITLYHNFGGWGANETNTSGLNNTDYIFNMGFPNGYTVTWNCYACDNASKCSFAASNYTVSTPPIDLTTLLFKYKVNNFTTVYPQQICWYFFGDNEFCIGNDGNATIYASTLEVNGSIVAEENITAEYFKGDGSELTGIPNNRTDVNFTYTVSDSFDASIAGTANNPTYGFDGLSGIGMYANDNNNLRFASSNAQVMYFAYNQITTGYSGSKVAPAFTFGWDDVGIFRPAADQIALAAGQVEFIRGVESTQDELVCNDDSDDVDFRVESDNDANAFFVNGANGSVGIGTNSPSYPLEVNWNTSGISIFSQANISATGYNTRTSVFDKNRGSALDYIKDADDYLAQGKINYSSFYGQTKPIWVTDYRKPVLVFYNETRRNETTKKDYNVTINVTTYPHKKQVGQVSLDQEVNVLRQAVYELKQKVAALETALALKP